MKSNVKADRTARLGALALLVTIASPSITVAGQIDTSAAAKYPRYRMVVLGTLGGPSSAPNAPAVSLNNRGQIVAQANTPTADPYPFNITGDGLVWHAILSNATDIIRDLGALPGTNSSWAAGISESGLIAGWSQNGLLDPLTGWPEMRAVF